MNNNPYQAPLHSGPIHTQSDPAKVIAWIEGLGRLLMLHAFVQPTTALIGIAFFYPKLLYRHATILCGFLLLMMLMNLLAACWVGQRKGALFGITTLLIGLVNVFTVFALLPSVCVSFFGLSVLLHPMSREIFKLSDQGKSKQQILDELQSNRLARSNTSGQGL